MAMTSLTKRLNSKGTRQAIDYKEESVHNVLAIAQNTIMFIAKKIEESILCMITGPVLAIQLAAPQNPVANPPCTLLKVPKTLVIK